MNSTAKYWENIDTNGYGIVPSSLFNSMDRPPTITLYPDKITFSQEAHTALNNCTAILLLINYEEQSIIIKAATTSDDNAIEWVTKDKEKYISQLNCPSLGRYIYKEWDWDRGYRYRISGRLVKGDRKPILLFDCRDNVKAYKIKEQAVTKNGE